MFRVRHSYVQRSRSWLSTLFPPFISSAFFLSGLIFRRFLSKRLLVFCERVLPPLSFSGFSKIPGAETPGVGLGHVPIPEPVTVTRGMEYMIDQVLVTRVSPRLSLLSPKDQEFGRAFFIPPEKNWVGVTTSRRNEGCYTGETNGCLLSYKALVEEVS